MKSRVLWLMLLALGVSLGGCMFLPKEEVNPSPSHSSSSSSTTPQCAPMAEGLSDAEKGELAARALADPATKEIRAKLEARGYSFQEKPEVVLQYERGFIVVFSAVSTPQAPPDDFPITKPSPYPERSSARSDASRSKSPGPFGAGPANLIYLGLRQGSRAFAVIDQEEKTLHIYQDGERVFKILRGNILDQLRKNERFRKFEEWLSRNGKLVGAGAILDEASQDVYIIVYVGPQHAPGKPIETMALGYDSKPYKEAYIALAKPISVKNDEVLLDPETLVLLPVSKAGTSFLPGYPVKDVKIELVGDPVYTIISGGEKPKEFQHLRDFAFFTPLSTHHITPMPTPRAHKDEQAGRMPRELPSALEPQSITIFCWGLIDAPPDNILLRFKTDAELTLAAYNAAVQYASYGVVVAKDTTSASKPPVYLAGFSNLQVDDVKKLYAEALAKAADEDKPLKVPAESVIRLLEHRLRMPLEKLTELLLRLAQADKEGRFDAVYQELLPQGLNNLVEFFSSLVPKYSPMLARIPAYIRALSLEFDRVLSTKRLSPQTVPGLPELIGGVFKDWALETVKTLLNILWNAFVSFGHGDKVPRLFTEVFCDYDPDEKRLIFHIFYKDSKDLVSIKIHWDSLHDWLKTNLEVENFGFPIVRGIRENFDNAAAWRRLFSIWGVELQHWNPVRRGDALFIIVAIYLFYDQIEHGYRDDKGMRKMYTHEEQEILYHRLLRIMAFLYHASVAHHNFICIGISFVSLTETRLVLRRVESRGLPGRIPVEVVDIAVVNFTSVPNDDKGFDNIFTWIKSVIDIFTIDAEIHWNPSPPDSIPKPNPWESDGRGIKNPGFDIAVVVFTDPVDEDSQQAQRIRNLVNRVKNEIPWSSGHGYAAIHNPKDIIARLVLVTWEEVKNGKVTKWFSLINLGPAEISDREKRRLVEELTGEDYEELWEYIPPTNSSPAQTIPPSRQNSSKKDPPRSNCPPEADDRLDCATLVGISREVHGTWGELQPVQFNR